MRTKISWLIRCLNSTRFLLPLGVFGVAAIFTMGVVLATSSGVDGIGLFELESDANAKHDASTSPPDDWQNVNAGSAGTTCPAGSSCTARTGVLADITGSVVGQNDDIFTGGGSKDALDLNQWKWKFASQSAVDKDDLTNVYAAGYVINNTSSPRNGHTIIYFGGDRFANSGNALLGFWFLQQQIEECGPGTGGGSPFVQKGTCGTPAPTAAAHKDHDILVLANLTSGGDVPRMQVLEWNTNPPAGTPTCNSSSSNFPCLVFHTPFRLLLDESQSTARCTGSSSDDACITTNVSPTKLFWSYTPKVSASGGDCGSSSTNCAPPVSFFEGGVDITAVLGSTPCITTFLAETRSSSGSLTNVDYNATLKDLKLGGFPVCGLNVTKHCDTQTLASGSTVNFTFSGDVTATGATVYNVGLVDSFPTGATATSITPTSFSSVVPGTPAIYSGGFTFGSTGNISNTVTATGCDTSGCTPNTSNSITAAGSWDTSTCPLAASPGLLLTKTCAVSVVQSGSNLVLRVDISGNVCNTGNVDISGITVTDSVNGTLLSNISLPAGQCSVNFNTLASNLKSYFPSTCTTTDGGRCAFSDTVSASGTGALGTGTVTATPVTATCHLCPVGACSTGN